MNQDFRDLLAEFNAHGVEYMVASAWSARLAVPFADQVVNVLSRDDLIRNKKAAGREQDILDVKWLESTPERSNPNE